MLSRGAGRRLYREATQAVADHCEEVGLEVDDPEVLGLIAAMLGAHYALRGGGDALLDEIITEVIATCAKAQAALGEARRA